MRCSLQPRRACEGKRPSCSTIVMALELVTIAPPVVKPQLAPGAGVSSNAGVVAVALTRSRIHIPAAPCPGTPQKIKYSPAGCAAKRIMSVASEGSPSASLSVNAREIAGPTGCVGSGVCGAITWALCGNIPSWLRKSISVIHPTGATSVSPPSRNPLKFRAPFSPVSPAINWKRTVLAATSKVSQVGSTPCCWALAGPASERVTNPTIAVSVRPTVVGRRHLPAGGAIPSLGIVLDPSVELGLHHTKCRSVIVFFFSLRQLCRERMPSREDDDRDCRTDQAPAEDPDWSQRRVRASRPPAVSCVCPSHLRGPAGCTRRSWRICAILGKLCRAASGTWCQLSVPGLPTQ